MQEMCDTNVTQMTVQHVVHFLSGTPSTATMLDLTNDKDQVRSTYLASSASIF